MPKFIRAMTALLSAFMVFAPLSASACDLSCWLHQTAPDCHSAVQATEPSQNSISASPMDMSAEGGMNSPGLQHEATADYKVSTTTHHSMTAQMDVIRGPLEVNRNDANSNSGLNHSKKLYRCAHETCSQASASASPPSASGHQPACLQYSIDVNGGNPANLLTISQEAAPGTAPPITPAADLLTTLRI
jgi:hypothetical protein